MNRGYKNYLTREKNDKLKRERYVFLHSDTRKVADVFPDIERIEITYIQTHKAAIEIKPKENSIVLHHRAKMYLLSNVSMTNVLLDGIMI